jgi:hypothetical protein
LAVNRRLIPNIFLIKVSAQGYIKIMNLRITVLVISNALTRFEKAKPYTGGFPPLLPLALPESK